jgi:hypothetical protein
MKLYAGVFCCKRYNHFRECLQSLGNNQDCRVYAVPMDIGAMDIAKQSLANKELSGLFFRPMFKTLYQNYSDFIKTIIDLYPEDDDSWFLLTADDYKYHQGWFDKLSRFVDENPEPISHLSGDLESIFPWNGIHGAIVNNGVTGLDRHTVCGANMIFRRSLWQEIEAQWKSIEDDIMLDHRLCKMMHDIGLKTVGLNLAEHTGLQDSTMGNKSWNREDMSMLPEAYRGI